MDNQHRGSVKAPNQKTWTTKKGKCMSYNKQDDYGFEIERIEGNIEANAENLDDTQTRVQILDLQLKLLITLVNALQDKIHILEKRR